MSNHGSQILDNSELVFLRQTKHTSFHLSGYINKQNFMFLGEEYATSSTSTEKFGRGVGPVVRVLNDKCCGIFWGEKGVD